MRVSGAIHITGDVEGERVFMTYNKSKSKPAKPTGTGETDGWSAANQDGAVWMSMKLATDITEEEWSEPMKITGDGAMNVFIDNAAHTVPADEYGNVTSFTGSGCVIKVLDGINELIFNTSQTLIAGHWWISSIDLNPPAALSVGTISGNNTTSCVIYNHNWMSQSEDVVTIKFFITAIKSDGTYVYLSVVQTITKANKGAKGDKGDTGIPGYQGPIPYPAGAWNSSTTYTRTNLKVPYVIYNGLYYYLRPVASIQGGNDPQTDYAANGSNATWIKIEGMQWLFVEILLAQWAKLGSAIFTDNKLISQYGVLNGSPSYNYTAGGFIPNLLLDFLNGTIKSKDAEIEGLIKGKSGYFEGLVRIPFVNVSSSINWWLGKDGDHPIITQPNVASSNIIAGSIIQKTVINLPEDSINGYRISIFNKETEEISYNAFGKVDVNAGSLTILNSNFGSTPPSPASLITLSKGEYIELVGVGTIGWIITNRFRAR